MPFTSVSGFVFEDLNGNGEGDTEPGLDEWYLTLFDESDNAIDFTAGEDK